MIYLNCPEIHYPAVARSKFSSQIFSLKMDESADETQLLLFMEITGCSNIDTAREYMSFGGGLENAISLFMMQEPARPAPATTSPDVQFISETIRNPIESRTEQLVDDFSMHYDEELDVDFHEPFHQPEPIEVDPVWQRNDTLSTLFAPPSDIIFSGTVSRGKKVAVQKEKMLILTIHDPTDFQCQVLNRDLWKNKEVKQVISKHFIFLQVSKSSPDGQEHATFYPFYKYPYICVLDPLTGERIKFWNESPIEPEVFLFELLDLVPVEKPSDSASRSPVMSEEEQLRMALLISAGGEPEKIKNDAKIASAKSQDPSKRIDC
jgi:UBX domain-containing protein 7